MASFLKGVRTRFRNILQTEIKVGYWIIGIEVTEWEYEVFVSKASKCADKIKMYVEKLVAAEMEAQSDDITTIVDEDCILLFRGSRLLSRT